MISAPISRYGMRESRKRLEEVGFHPSVTLMTPEEMEQEVIEYLKSQVQREPRRDYYESQKLRLGARMIRQTGNKSRGKGRDKGRVVLTQVRT